MEAMLVEQTQEFVSILNSYNLQVIEAIHAGMAFISGTITAVVFFKWILDV